MQTEEITIRVDPLTAKAYREASVERRRKLDLLPNLRLSEVIEPGGTLEDHLRSMGREAARKGMTPEILEELLHDE